MDIVTKKQREAVFARQIKAQLDKDLPEYGVSKGTNLLYKLIVAPGFVLKPKDIKHPSRGNGQYGFQTDILISRKKDGTPLVVVELKHGGFSTHDVLTYSSKALKHKEIYPYLRYGFVVGGQKKIDQKFFTHNVGFDFALTVASYRTSGQHREFADLLRRQANIAEEFAKMIDGDKKRKRIYETRVVME
jgi:hypothetical protein